MAFVQAVPAAGAVTADLIAKAQDWPEADRFAERIKKTLPPGVAEDPEDMSPEEQQQMAMQQQQQAQEQQRQAQVMQQMESFKMREEEAKAVKAEADALKAQLEVDEMAIKMGIKPMPPAMAAQMALQNGQFAG